MNTFSYEVENQEQMVAFQSTVEAITRSVNLPTCIWTLDEQEQALKIVAAVGLPYNYVSTVSLALTEMSLTGEAFKNGEITTAQDITLDHRWKYKEIAKEMGWKSALCVPIRSQDLVIGVISIYAFVAREFSDHEQQVLTGYADQIALNIQANKNARMLKSLIEISQDFKQLITEDPQAVLGEIVEDACKITGADCAVIYPYDAEREEFYDTERVAHYGLQNDLVLKNKPRKKGLGAYVIRTGELVYSDIENEDPDLLKSPFIDRENIKAFMALSLKVADRVLGILYVDFRKPHKFTEDEKNTIRLFANQAALAIDNAGLYQQAQSRADALAKLHQVSPTLVSLVGVSGELDEVLTQIAQNALEVLNADLVDLYQYIQSRDKFILPPIQAGERYDSTAIKTKTYPGDVVSTIIKRRDPQYTRDSQAEPAMVQPPKWEELDIPLSRFVIREQIESTAAIPLVVANEVVGVLFVNYRVPQSFSQQQQESIELFAAQAAIAIRNTRLLEQRQTLQEITRDITSILEKDNLFQRILEHSLGLLGSQAGSICLLNQRTNKLEFQYAIGKERFLSVPFGEGLIGTAAQLQKPVCVSDVKNDARYIEHVSETQSELDVPLLIGDELIGVLNIENVRSHAFSEADEALAVTLADLAAVALYNAELFEQRRLLQEIAQDIASELEREALIQKIIEQSTALLKCETGAIGLVDPTTGAIEYKYGVAIEGEFLRTVPAGQGLSGRAVVTKTPVRIDDVQTDKDYIAHYPTTRSELVIPLQVRDTVLGVLDFQSPHVGAFDPQDEALALALANHAAVALDNAQLFEQTREQLEQRLNDLQALESVYAAVGQAPLEDLLALVVKQAVDLTHAHYGNLWLVEQEQQQLRFGTEVSLLSEPSSRKGRIPIDEHSINGWVALTGQAYRCQDVKADDPHYQSINENIRSELAVPLRRGDRIIGTLNLESTTLAAFTQDHERLLMALANSAAVAIDNAFNYERLEILARLSQSAASTIDLDELLARILDESMKALGAHYGTLRMLNRSTGNLELRAHRGLAREETLENLPLGEGLVGWVAEKGQPCLIGDVRKDKRYLQAAAKTRSELDVPIKVEDRVIGTINLEHPSVDAFDEYDLHLLEAIANQVALTIRRARLYEAQPILNQMGQMLTQGTRLQEVEVLELIRLQAGKLMDTDNMYIALYDEATDIVRFGLAYVGGKEIDVETDKNWQPRKAGKGKTEEIIRKRDPIFHATQQKAEDWYAQPGHEEYVGSALPSWIGVPMMVGEKVLGVVATYHPEKEYIYNNDDLIVLQAIANQAAIALDNSRMFYDINQRLETLVKFGQILAANIQEGEQKLLEIVKEQASSLMDTDNMYIALYDEANDVVRFGLAFVDGRRIDIEKEPGWQPRRSGKGITEQVIHNKKPILITTKKEAEDWYAKPGHQEYVGTIFASWLGVPMMTGDNVSGIIATYHKEHEYLYSTDDQEVLQGMANLTAVALDNARLLGQERWAKRLKGLLDINQQITAQLALDEVLISVVENANSIMGADFSTLFLYDADNGEFLSGVRRGKINDIPSPPSSTGFAARVARRQEFVFIKDIETHEGVKTSFIEAKGIQSYIAAPLVIGVRTVGIVFVNYLTSHTFSPGDKEAIRILANQAAIAIHNAELYQQARADIVAAKQLSTLGTAIAALQHRINNTLNIIVPNVARLRKRVDLTDKDTVDILDIIERNARYTSNIMSRIQEPLQEIEIRDMDINAVLNEIALDINGHPSEPGYASIEVVLELDDTIPIVRVPVGQISEIFRNLVDNACRVMKQGGKLAIISCMEDSKICVRVQDTGPGIPMQIRDRLFNKPVSGQNSGSGAGLGLWLSQLMLQSLGGTIAIERSNTDGTTMLVQIPLMDAKKEVLL